MPFFALGTPPSGRSLVAPPLAATFTTLRCTLTDGPNNTLEHSVALTTNGFAYPTSGTLAIPWTATHRILITPHNGALNANGLCAFKRSTKEWVTCYGRGNGLFVGWGADDTRTGVLTIFAAGEWSPSDPLWIEMVCGAAGTGVTFHVGEDGELFPYTQARVDYATAFAGGGVPDTYAFHGLGLATTYPIVQTVSSVEIS